MADVKARNKKTGEIQEMSAYQFDLLHDEWDLVQEKLMSPSEINGFNPETNPEGKPQEVPKNAPRETLIKRYTELYGTKPHHLMKDQTLEDAIFNKEKENSMLVQ